MSLLQLELYVAQRAQWPERAPRARTVRLRIGRRAPGDKMLEAYATPCRIEDISGLVREQRARFVAGGNDALLTPRERVYPCTAEIAVLLGVDD